MTLSRTATVIAALLGAAPAQADVTIERYHAVTSVEPHCGRPSDSREILVCGARRADRWRVPFIGGYEIGDPRGESVEAERKRISSAHRPPCGRGAIIADCGGGVGVSATVAFGASGSEARLRPLAP